MIGRINRAIACAALASLGVPVVARAQTQATAAATTTVGHLEACEAPLTKVLQSTRTDGSCPFNQPKIDWSRYALHGLVEAETAARAAALAAEAAAREAADAILQANIDAVATAGSGPLAALQAAIDAETAARIAGDQTLQSRINAEQGARVTADAALQQAIEAEAAARTTAVNTLQSHINAEQGARVTADAATLTAAKAYTDEKVAQVGSGNAPAGTLHGVQSVTSAVGNVPGDGGFTVIVASCPAGKIAIAGGWVFAGGTPGRVLSSRPAAAGWQVEFATANGAGGAAYAVIATCVNATP
jgi:hypothetical protein